MTQADRFLRHYLAWRARPDSGLSAERLMRAFDRVARYSGCPDVPTRNGGSVSGREEYWVILWGDDSAVAATWSRQWGRGPFVTAHASKDEAWARVQADLEAYWPHRGYLGSK